LKSLLVALSLAAATALSAPEAGANLLSPSDEKAYREAFAHAQRGRFEDAHQWAARASDKLLGTALKWMHYVEPRSGASFAEITRFISANPSWPQQTTLRRRAEEAITVATPAAEMLAWFDANPPVTVDGKMAYGGALLTAGRRDHAIAVLRDAWVGGTFGVLQERNFVARFGDMMRPEDHVARLDRLLWDRHEDAAQRMVLRVDMPHRLLAQARLALMNNKPGVDAAVDRVPKALANDPGLIFERVRWRRQHDLDDGAYELLRTRPALGPRGDSWWTERAILARRALQKGFISRAYDIAKHHGLNEGASFAEAEWLAGWIALRFLDDRKVALEHFKRLYDNVETPISRSRGAYWAGRAAEAMKDAKAAETWYERAAAHVTTYYGQLAAGRLSKDHSWPLPADPLPDADDIAAFERQPLVQVARMLAEIGREEQAAPFVLRLHELAKTPGQRALAASLAASVRRPDLAVSIARRADREGVPMIGSGYPVPKLDVTRPEKALVLALIRQESGFHERAVSAVGARGLMQLMPATARSMARLMKVGYAPQRLHEPEYNVRLGTRYLGDLIEGFNGSYILSLAAYNAGPGRVRSWIREYGDPRNPEVDPIDWIENIPFSETRNYVQRVLESLQVYRRRLGATDFQRSLERDLRR